MKNGCPSARLGTLSLKLKPKSDMKQRESVFTCYLLPMYLCVSGILATFAT